MKAITCIFLSTFLCVSAMAADESAPAAKQVNSARTSSLTSQAFVKNASQDGMLEVEAGKVALAQGSSNEVKTFAQRMVTDHGKANEQLKSVATGSKIAVADKLDAKHQAKLTALKSKKGSDFDKAYGAEMMKGHEQAVALFEKASTSSTVSADLQLFARKTLPTLQEHAQLAMKLPK